MSVKFPVHCANPECKSKFSDFYYVDGLDAPCPGCGMKGVLIPMNDVHFVFPDPRGILRSKLNGLTFSFGCESAKIGFVNGIKDPRFPVFYSPAIESTTCPKCLETVAGRVEIGELVSPEKVR